MGSDTKKLVIAGERLGRSDVYKSGFGTYVLNNHIHSSLVGESSVCSETNEISVLPLVKQGQRQSIATELVLHPNDTVTCKVQHISIRQVNVDILLVGDRLLPEPLSGIIRREDVMLKDSEHVVIEEKFTPNDIVLAAVLSIGDSRSYYLSTAKDGLGVIKPRVNNS